MPRKYILKSQRTSNVAIDFEKDLTEEQYKVVTAPKGPLLVIAGAGSGKTRTITYRLAYLVQKGISLKSLLLLTFTNKAAHEMVSRVECLLKRDLNPLWAGTFHHVGNLILRRHAEKLGYTDRFTILDRNDSKDLMAEVIKEEKKSSQKKYPKPEVLLDVYSYWINTMKSFHQLFEEKYSHLFEWHDEIKKIFKGYEEKKKRANLMDFDDLLKNWLLLIQDNNDLLDKYSQRFRHILIDEYQDTNYIQAEITNLLASHHKNIMVVGDDAQSIYSFRGAEFKNIIDFPKKYPDCQIYKLETNHRSTPEILNIANESINLAKVGFAKNLRAKKQAGKQPAVVSFTDVYKQAEFIGQRILELHNEGIPLSKMAVLYRSHYHSLELQMELSRRSIPHEVRSGIRFFEEAHIKDIIAYLKVVVNPRDLLAWRRILRIIPNVGDKTSERLLLKINSSSEPEKFILSQDSLSLVAKNAQKSFQDFQTLIKKLQKSRQPSPMIDTIIDSGYSEYLKISYINYENRLQEIKELIDFALIFNNLQDFLSTLSLAGNVSGEEIISSKPREKEAVVLSTVHQAKGLEWDVVFIIWLAEGRFPSYLSFGDSNQEEEERRLFYVAVTRSKSELYLTYPISHRTREGRIILKSSRFLQEISDGSYEKWLVEEEFNDTEDDFSDDLIEEWD